MDMILNRIARLLDACWHWLVALNGAAQSALVLVMLVTAFALAYYARGLQRPDFSGEGPGGKTLIATLVYIVGVICALIALAALAAVLAQLIGL